MTGETQNEDSKNKGSDHIRSYSMPQETSVSPVSKRLTLRSFPPAIALAVFLAFVFLLKYLTVARHLDMGCDIATYLATMNAFFGQAPTGFGLDRPPLIALPLKVFTLVFGDLTGVKLLGVLLSVSIGIPFYLLAKRISHPWIAVAMTVVFVLTPAYSDMLAWGYITMTGILFGLLTLHFFLLLIEKPTKLNIVLTGAFASLVVGFHQLSLAFFVPLFVLLVLALLAFNREPLVKNYKAALAATIIAVLLSIPYAPLYLKMLQMQSPSGAEASISLTSLYLPWILGIILSLPLVIVSLRWTWQRHRNTSVATGILLIYSLVLILFLLPAPFLELNRRAHYFMYIAIWLLVSITISHIWSWKTLHISTVRRWLPKAGAATLIAISLPSTLVMSQLKLSRGLDFFGYLDETRGEAVSLISDNTLGNATVTVYPETFGWWIEGEAVRNTATVTDRNIVPYTFLRERSLVAERILSRNQGIDNGNLRLATTYPYSDAPGQPVLGVYAGGSYHDVITFDESNTSLIMENGEVANLAVDSIKEFSISGDSDSITMITVYRINGVRVTQTATLHRSSQSTIISYDVQSEGDSLINLYIPVFFGFEPKSVSIDAEKHSIEVLQYLRTQSDRVNTRIDVASKEAILQTAIHQEDRIDLSFSIQGEEATITFSFEVTDPNLSSSEDVTYYQVPQILKDPALEHVSSIDYLAVDLKPNPHLASELPWQTEQWLNACPYYKLVYSEGDIRIYQVETSALP